MIMKGDNLRTTLVFDNTFGGHHLEYLHHLHTLAISRPAHKYIFAIPDSFISVLNKMKWEKSTNVTYHFLNEGLCCRDSNWIKRSYSLSKQMIKIAKMYNVDCVFLISLMDFMPFLPFVWGAHFRVSGIIYKIYLYTWLEKKCMARGLDILKYTIFSRFHIFEKIFLLNDKFAPLYYNKRYGCNKFYYLPDPYSPISTGFAYNLRKDWKISDDQKVIIHFGGLGKRKGTLEIFKMIYTIPLVDQDKYVFVFAGKVYGDIREEFYNHYNILKQSVRLFIFDEFCSFDFIESLCISCDAILLPYHETAQSSGVIGYAAQFKKPVIVPNQGLIGKLVRKNHLGILFNHMTSASIYEALGKVDDWVWVDKGYIEKRKVDDFLEALV